MDAVEVLSGRNRTSSGLDGLLIGVEDVDAVDVERNIGCSRLGRAHPRRQERPQKRTSSGLDGLLIGVEDVDAVDVERNIGCSRLGRAHPRRQERPQNGRLVDWTVCSSAWRTWTRSTWSETPGAPDSAAPSTAPGAAANGRLADRSPSPDPRPRLIMP